MKLYPLLVLVGINLCWGQDIPLAGGDGTPLTEAQVGMYAKAGKKPPIFAGFLIETTPESSISDCVLWIRLEKFSYNGTPVGLIQKIRDEIDPRIGMSRIVGESDGVTHIQVADHSGSILELLIKAFPFQYKQPAVTLTILENGGVLVRCKGPLPKTPTTTPEGLKFISPF